MRKVEFPDIGRGKDSETSFEHSRILSSVFGPRFCGHVRGFLGTRFLAGEARRVKSQGVFLERQETVFEGFQRGAGGKKFSWGGLGGSM